MNILVKSSEGQIMIFDFNTFDIDEITNSVKREVYKTEKVHPEEQILLVCERNQFIDGVTTLPQSTIYLQVCKNKQFFVRFLPDESLTLRLEYPIRHDKIQYYREIFAKFATGKSIRLELGSCHTVDDVMKKIQDMERIPSALQRLMFCRKDLDNANDKLVDYGIKGGSVLELSLSIIFAKELSDQQLCILQVKSSDSIRSVKEKIHRETRTYRAQMKDLSDDNLSLGQYNIDYLSTIYFSWEPCLKSCEPTLTDSDYAWNDSLFEGVAEPDQS
ncbi:hypothetical protein SUGI_0042570 [Cryptomeria japonica]|nr:hypothetical protein SUGI_0042570 [Cryptomeria japonica]